MIVYPSEESSDLADSALGYRDDENHNADHSKAEVEVFLKRVKSCIQAGRFIVLGNEDGTREGRQKNTDFLNTYGLYTKESQASLLMSIVVEDFSHSVKASDGRELYVFCIRRSLYKTSYGPCSVWIYIKHDCAEEGEPYDVVISMHELEKPIDLIFAD